MPPAGVPLQPLLLQGGGDESRVWGTDKDRVSFRVTLTSRCSRASSCSRASLMPNQPWHRGQHPCTHHPGTCPCARSWVSLWWTEVDSLAV